MKKVRLYAGQRDTKPCLKICRRTRNGAEKVTESTRYMSVVLEIELEDLLKMAKEHGCDINSDTSLYPIIYGKRRQLNRVIKQLEPWMLACEMRN